MSKTKAVTFYAVKLNGELKKTMGKITWKFGKWYKDELTNEIKYSNDDLDIQFEDWRFTTDNPDQIAYLNIYNSWWLMTLSDWREVRVPVEWQLFRITKDDPNAEWVKIVTEEKKVIKEVISSDFLDFMDIDAKIAFAKRNNIELPWELTVANIDRVIKEAWHIL